MREGKARGQTVERKLIGNDASPRNEEKDDRGLSTVEKPRNGPEADRDVEEQFHPRVQHKPRRLRVALLRNKHVIPVMLF